jgi:hypothetical protein
LLLDWLQGLQVDGRLQVAWPQWLLGAMVWEGLPALLPRLLLGLLVYSTRVWLVTFINTWPGPGLSSWL